MSEKKLHLQGLRAIAISSVLLFHFYPQWFPNGYLGVDQFFFLSGYLMTMMMCRYKQGISFSNIFDFLYRRVKRIVPLYYLCTLLILISLFFTPISAVLTNLNSSIPALLFGTNLVRPTGLEGYEEKLGVAVDMFTHTWSLSLEMQFYLLFPLIFILSHNNGKPRESVLYLLALTSFIFYLSVDDFLSFNCVFSRIWQFIAGVIIFDLSLKKEPKDDFDSELVEEKSLKRNELLLGISLFLTISLLFFHHPIDPLYARTTITLLTAIIVHIGEMNHLLENVCSVYIGEISYGWYLIHWPIVAHLKLNGYHTVDYMTLGLAISFLISAILHHFYEERYISWKRVTIISNVLLLLILNVAILQNLFGISPQEKAIVATFAKKNTSLLNSSYFYASDFEENASMGYENMTKQERANLNSAYNSGDGKQLLSHPCQKLAAADKNELRCIVSATNSTKKTLLVIGNSYARNTIEIISQECKSKFGKIYLSSTPACEPLFETVTVNYNCTTYGIFFMEAVESIKPDVLLMVTRQVQLAQILGGSNPFNDHHYKTAAKRLQFMEKHVKGRIFLMDGFAEPKKTMSIFLNKFLKEGKNFTDSEVIDLNRGVVIAKERISRLAMSCSKCRVFDYGSRFYFNGQYKPYDPQYFVSFFTSGVHLTPAGLERVRPLFRDICNRPINSL